MQIHRSRNSGRRAQRGAAMIIMMLIIVLGLVGLFTYRLDRKGAEQKADRQTALALAQAKEALLGDASADNNHPGSLPCPDTHALGDINEGFADPTCTGNALGRLPWKTLGLPDLRDGAQERLWYKLSSNFRDMNIKINTTTTGTLAVSGKVATAGIAAIVFSPGPPISTQMRDVSNYNVFSHYLEGYSSAGDTTFVASTSSLFNDKFITLTPTELMVVATKRMAGEVRTYLNSPYPATLPTLPSWAVVPNDWPSQMAYTRISSTSATLTFYGGCLLYNYVWDGSTTQMNVTKTCLTQPW